MIRVVGLDLSLTGTGIALRRASGDDGGWLLYRVESKGRATATLAERGERLLRLKQEICSIASGVDLIVIEQPAFSRTVGSQHDRSGLWWLVVDHVLATYPVAEISPSARAKYATGKGNAKKDEVLAAACKRYPEADIASNDTADAVVLASMGARFLGYPVEASMPQLNLAAMNSVKWPPVPVAAR